MRDFIEVKGLCISAEQDHRQVQIVSDVSFSLEKGKVLALIGESGSGKTTIALSLMGYTKPGCSITQGEVWLGDDDLLTATPEQLCNWRGKRVAYIAQSAAAAFNPGKRLIDQVIESALRHRDGTREQLKEKAIQLFKELVLPEPETIGQRYPHEVSGGQLQRIMAAMALIAEPELVILDEPTTALDVTTQVGVLQVFRQIVKQRQVTAVYVSHDLAVVAQVADKVVVLNHGEIQETSDIETILDAPAHPYTRELMQAASPVQKSKPVTLAQTQHQNESKPSPLLSVRKLVAGYGPRNKMGMPEFPVLDDIRFKLWPGQAIGIIGESGSGKSTLAKTLVGMLPAALGNVKYRDTDLPAKLNQRSKEQCRKIQLVFQNAETALNPKHTVRQLLERPLKTYFKMSGRARHARIEELLRLVQLPEEVIDRKPSALSGGQKQRVNLARALAAEPDIIICDEVTSALDTVVGAAILELLNDLKDRLGFAYLFISHDMNSVKALCDDVIVLYKGTQVQSSPVNGLYHGPLHPYTALLMDSVPQLRTDWIHEPRIATRVSGFQAAAGQPEMCAFVERCPQRIAGVCANVSPSHRKIHQRSHILCHLQDNKLQTLATLSDPEPEATEQNKANIHPLAKFHNKEHYA
ncbi:Glutathione import ATP-binding protein GsiA [Vibrio aerogenes CECT 7868]|uniref:Glutathione import ATP-binding protein GsiA n=1 Tax=Vibrio aerogenes CECT 7868 TaxID=1216006 RepID=A0A1M6D4U6_9VIBR|nr:ABC transporter ATP-binding protein [Vibrio aerogenes]SHI68266.1 Glutathione import ATP-binding protein GsiA [Vibrio aerogenes CECT 7868]